MTNYPKTEHFAFKVPFMEDGTVTHYVIPRSDARLYETPASILFDTREDAIEWFDEDRLFHVEEGNTQELEYMDSWLLVKITMEVWA